MLRRLVKDESGMTMALAIITMVLIGVMGAGLLTFVQRDLETVVEVNQGQKALEMADVGIQEARRQLIADSVRQHYDRNRNNDCEALRAREGEDWSPVSGAEDCVESDTDSAPGVSRKFEGGQFEVTIECYVQQGDPANPAPCSQTEAGGAPEDVDPRRRSFFKIVSTGLYPNQAGSKRRVEAIVQRESRGLPLAYYTPENIDLNGTVEVGGVSFFAGGDITGAGGSSTKVGSEPDLLLGDWSTASPSTLYVPGSNHNTSSRGTVATGFGAAGSVCEGNSTSNCKTPPDETSYFDANSTPQLVYKEDPEVANETGTISYPFDPAARPDMELLIEEATKIGTYYAPSGGSFSIDESIVNRAQTGTSTPVVFVDFRGAASTGNNAKWDTDYDNASAPIVLVVRNGNFDFTGSNGKKDGDGDGQAELRGVVIVEGDGSKTGSYKAAGNSELAGFVFADGGITLTGNARAESLLVPDDGGNAVPTDFFDRLLAFNRVRLWSWQEVYQ